MKSLIILAHPDIENSLINKRFLKEPPHKISRSLSLFSLPRSRAKTLRNISFLALCSGMRCEQSCTTSASKTARRVRLESLNADKETGRGAGKF